GLMAISNRVECSIDSFDAVYDAKQKPVDRYFVCFSGNVGRVFDVIDRIRRLSSQPILVVAKATPGQLVLRAMKLAADCFLDEEDVDVELGAVLNRFRGKTTMDAPLGEITGVLPVCGGCGASTVSINLAALLARKHGKCLLLDLNPGRGDLSA